jgi:hypothetical protein
VEKLRVISKASYKKVAIQPDEWAAFDPSIPNTPLVAGERLRNVYKIYNSGKKTEG